MIRDLKGDVLRSKAEAIVIPVNCVGVLGAGLARAWEAQATPDDVSTYKTFCRAGKAHLGIVWATKRHAGRPQSVFFPTKRHWREGSKIQAITEGLESLRTLIGRQKIVSIALPALGCGLGGLAWRSVRREIEHALSDVDCDVQLFAPQPERK